jgi:hypothetical protein
MVIVDNFERRSNTFIFYLNSLGFSVLPVNGFLCFISAVTRLICASYVASNWIEVERMQGEQLRHLLTRAGISQSVRIATGCGLDDRVPVGSRIFSTSSRPALGPTQPHIQWEPGALSPGVKRQGRKADHSPPTSVSVKKMWIYTSTLPYAFTA